MAVDIILIEPKTQKNVGAAARVMKNFEFDQLVLIEPKCKIGVEARKVAKHAQGILNNTKIKKHAALKKYDYLIGTTAILGRDYNLPRNPISPRQCAERIQALPKKAKVALIIGRESTGLTNEEIEACDILVNIPASKKYPTLNVSHALTIMVYEFFQAKTVQKSNSHIAFATKTEKDVIQKLLSKTITKLPFETKEKKDTQRKVWKRIIGKALLTKRESFVIMGYLRKIIEKK